MWARWTTYHVRQLSRSMEEVFRKKGICFIEVLSPCPTLYQRRNKVGVALDTMKYYKDASRIRHGAPTAEWGLSMTGEIVVGKFVDRGPPGLPGTAAIADGDFARQPGLIPIVFRSEIS